MPMNNNASLQNRVADIPAHVTAPILISLRDGSKMVVDGGCIVGTCNDTFINFREPEQLLQNDGANLLLDMAQQPLVNNLKEFFNIPAEATNRSAIRQAWGSSSISSQRNCLDFVEKYNKLKNALDSVLTAESGMVRGDVSTR